MKILLTGVTGYIGKRLLPVLLNQGYEVICAVRDKQRFDLSKYKKSNLKVIEVNLLNKESLKLVPEDIDAAYYLVHSMTASTNDFEQMEELTAINFKERINETKARQVIYVSGIVNDDKLSKHLLSRKKVETILSNGKYALTTLRAGIIVGSGSASFEIVRDLVEKLPVMITPKWLNTKSQPIAIRNVLEFMNGVLLNQKTFNKSYDIGGPGVLTYKKMLLDLAEIRNLKRKIWVIPVMTPKLSSYWLYFVTSTSYKLAVNLVTSMKVEVICKPNNLAKDLGINLISYKNALRMAFEREEQHLVESSWKDALTDQTLEKGVSNFIKVPTYGCFHDTRKQAITDINSTLNNIWSIGGKNGWYYASWLWVFRVFIDKLFGGVGLRRGRRDDLQINTGDSLDFWRVLDADKINNRLLLFAEMKLPGEAWLEFKIQDNTLFQTATFRPLGLWGRIYWFLVYPFHGIIFKGMCKRIAQ